MSGCGPNSVSGCAQPFLGQVRCQTTALAQLSRSPRVRPPNGPPISRYRLQKCPGGISRESVGSRSALGAYLENGAVSGRAQRFLGQVRCQTTALAQLSRSPRVRPPNSPPISRYRLPKCPGGISRESGGKWPCPAVFGASEVSNDSSGPAESIPPGPAAERSADLEIQAPEVPWGHISRIGRLPKCPGAYLENGPAVFGASEVSNDSSGPAESIPPDHAAYMIEKRQDPEYKRKENEDTKLRKRTWRDNPVAQHKLYLKANSYHFPGGYDKDRRCSLNGFKYFWCMLEERILGECLMLFCPKDDTLPKDYPDELTSSEVSS
ncbi:hypothetical protein Ddc_04642 [Ditylenchus destructor]|nr:hypothetical protein Ddc_04642 [Ditylenchus destructor]